MPDLPADVVWKLLTSTADSDDALDRLRILSQVSKPWRSLGLSPLLWVKAFNLEELRLKKMEWRMECLKRTGDLPLDIKAAWVPTVIQKFFLHEVLAPNMHRIRSLIAHVGLLTYQDSRDSAWSVIFDQPAPLLEVFSLDFDAHHEQVPPRAIRHALKDKKPLFAGHAPALRAFNDNPFFVVSSGARSLPDWFGNLTTLMLSSPPRRALAILQNTPQLERLFLKTTEFGPRDDDGADGDGTQAPSSVLLPRLGFMHNGSKYSSDDFYYLPSAIQTRSAMSLCTVVADKKHLEVVLNVFRDYVEKVKPTKVIITWPIFSLRFGDVSITGDVDDYFHDPGRKDFSIRLGYYTYYREIKDDDILELMTANTDFSSLKECIIQRRADSSYDSGDRNMNKLLKAFLEKALYSGSALAIDAQNYKHFVRKPWLHDDAPVLTKDIPVRIVENASEDSDSEDDGDGDEDDKDDEDDD